MQITTVLSALFATALASPLASPQTGQDRTWKPNSGTTVACDKNSDKFLNFYIGHQLEPVLNQACAQMMPPCAFPSNDPDTICTATIDFKLDGPRNSTQSVLVQGPHARLPGWKAKFAVYPPKQPKNEAGVFWQVKDCYGYFAYMLVNSVDHGGCHTDDGFGLGNVTVGAGNSLEGTVFEVTAVNSP